MLSSECSLHSSELGDDVWILYGDWKFRNSSDEVVAGQPRRNCAFLSFTLPFEEYELPTRMAVPTFAINSSGSLTKRASEARGELCPCSAIEWRTEGESAILPNAC